MPRILLLSNIPTPYQFDFWGAVAKKADMRAVFLWAKEANRDWKANYPEWVTILDYKDMASGWNKFQALLDDFKPDVVIVGGYRLPLAQQSRAYALRKKIRFYYWLEKPLPTSSVKRFLRTIIWRLTLPFAHGVLCIGSEAEKTYAPFARRTLNLPYAIAASRYKLRGQEEAALPLKFLFVGQYIPRKGVSELLEAFAAISPQTATLSLVGSGELKEQVTEYTQRFSHIRELGFVEPDALPRVFSEHDVFILPSRHDGWAVVVAEALAVGLPVVGTAATGAFIDLVEKNDCGRKCDVSAASIKQAVEYYTVNPDRVRAQGKKGRDILLKSPAAADNAARLLLKFLE